MGKNIANKEIQLTIQGQTVSSNFGTIDSAQYNIEQLLNAGIDVISTLNIQHLESLNDVISRITGTLQRETVPDEIVRRADQLELVDMTPEALRRRGRSTTS